MSGHSGRDVTCRNVRIGRVFRTGRNQLRKSGFHNWSSSEQDPILKKLRLLKIQDEHSLSLHQLGWEFLNNILPISIGNYITPKVNLAGTRNPSRVMEILPSYANGSYQIGSLLRKQINTLNLSEINLMNKKILRKSITTKILNTYHESVICFNRGCTECMV